MSLRRRTFLQLDPRAHGPTLSWTNRVIVVLILASSALAILETEPSILPHHRDDLARTQMIIAAVFLAEYLARLWTCVEDPRFAQPLAGRLRYIFTLPAILDLLALVPALFLVAAGETMLLRAFQLMRVLTLARAIRFSPAMRYFGAALSARRPEIYLTIGAALVLMLVSSTLLYIVEGHTQPERFGSIPRAMWWSVVTLTTVGYGDVYPMTILGRILAAFTAFAGIGLVAMPAGIFAAAFSDAVRRERTGDIKEGERPDA